MKNEYCLPLIYVIEVAQDETIRTSLLFGRSYDGDAEEDYATWANK